MEVHHHPHVEKKSFKEYLLEGLMIFLAVSMGFIAENIREHIADNAKEKEFMHSMILDLKSDTANISRALNRFSNISKMEDTILISLKSEPANPVTINRMISKSFWTYTGYSYNNRTVQQLKNAGNFRLVRNEAVADSISKYDNNINTIVLTQYLDLKNSMIAYKDIEARVVPYRELKQNNNDNASRGIDTSIFAPAATSTFISNDKALLSLYYNKLFIHKTLTTTFISNLGIAKQHATSLIAFIQNEYHLEKE